MSRITFTIPGEPRGKGRPRIVRIRGFARMAPDAKTASYENLVALAARDAMAGLEPFSGAVALTLRARLAPAASASRKARAAMLAGEVHPTKKPDLDNLAKAVLDGLNGVAFRDDVLVIRLTAEKLYAETPGVDVVVEVVR